MFEDVHMPRYHDSAQQTGRPKEEDAVEEGRLDAESL